MDADTESYILILLADSNLPTGSFVASSGLESYIAHGFFATQNASSTPSDARPASRIALDNVIRFVQDNLHSYANSALPFVTEAHAVTLNYLQLRDEVSLDATICSLYGIDSMYESMTLNHVSRRASRSQGMALLTLYIRGLVKPSVDLPVDGVAQDHDARASQVIDSLKAAIRQEKSPGHLPICWGILTAALGLNAVRSRYLHLFLQARGLLSAAVRLNICGPYAAQQLLLHSVRPIVDAAAAMSVDLRVGTIADEVNELMLDDCPATTWPLGEILAARHDLQHSKIFNS